MKYIFIKNKKEDNINAKKVFIKYTKEKLILSNSNIKNQK